MSKVQSFREEVKQALQQIYTDEGSILAIHIDQPQIQDLLQSFQDQDSSIDYEEIIHDELENFQPNF